MPMIIATSLISITIKIKIIIIIIITHLYNARGACSTEGLIVSVKRWVSSVA